MEITEQDKEQLEILGFLLALEEMFVRGEISLDEYKKRKYDYINK